MRGMRANDKLFGRCLVGGWDWEAPSSSDDLVLCPVLGKVVQSSPEWSKLPFDLQCSNGESVTCH